MLKKFDISMPAQAQEQAPVPAPEQPVEIVDLTVNDDDVFMPASDTSTSMDEDTYELYDADGHGYNDWSNVDDDNYSNQVADFDSAHDQEHVKSEMCLWCQRQQVCGELTATQQANIAELEAAAAALLQQELPSARLTPEQLEKQAHSLAVLQAAIGWIHRAVRQSNNFCKYIDDYEHAMYTGAISLRMTTQAFRTALTELAKKARTMHK